MHISAIWLGGQPSGRHTPIRDQISQVDDPRGVADALLEPFKRTPLGTGLVDEVIDVCDLAGQERWLQAIEEFLELVDGS